MNSEEYRAILQDRECTKPLTKIVIASDGSLLTKDENFLSRYSQENAIFDLSHLKENEALTRFLSNCPSRQIKTIQIDGNTLLSQCNAVERLADLFFSESSALRHLEGVYFLHIPFNSHLYQHLFSRLITWINPSSSITNFGKWKALRLYDCHFSSPRHPMQLLQAIRGNAFLLTLDLSYCHPPLNDEAIAVLRSSLTKYESNLTSLTLCHHSFTVSGLSDISHVIRHTKNKIQKLNLSNNPSISLPSPFSLSLSDVLIELTLAALSTRQLRELSLSHCNISDCAWSQYLSFLPSLQLLDLSCNSIDDNHLIALLRNISHSFSLREVKLARNLFHHSRIAASFSSLLSLNHSLQSLDLSLNRFDIAVWRGIAEGLMTNPSLLLLSCNGCSLGMKEIETITAFMGTNDICELSLLHNPLPPDLICSPRSFLAKQNEINDKESQRKNENEKNRILPLAVRRERRAIEAAREWRIKQHKKILLSLQTLHIINNHKESKANQIDESFIQTANGTGATFHNNDEGEKFEAYEQVMNSANNTTNTLNDTLTSTLPHNTTRPPPTSHPNREEESMIDGDWSWACWKKEIIEQSDFFFSSASLDEALSDLAQLESNDSKQIVICFGRPGFVIGEIELKKRFTYHYIREEYLIPMVRDYCQSVSEEEREAFMNFSIVTMKEEVIAVREMKARKVWSDLYKEEEAFLLLRPANHIKLTDP